ncbi:MAG: CinA family nicotinamide mononucleotide deamidase-related protein [Acidobacteria bacterium]|nr:CinA family nicotinamide mononucleotide deamidase-related protein [Acidobacteriota bacterium]
MANTRPTQSGLNRVEIITTGEEVIHGELVDTNASWLSEQLASMGFQIQRRSTVGDRLDDLVNLFLERAAIADIIIVNGGLGPTVDDLSAEAAAMALGEPRIIHETWLNHLESWFKERGRQMPDNNRKQAYLPQSAQIIDNPYGTACGFRIKLSRAELFFTPGVPRELRPMFSEQIAPYLNTHYTNKPRFLKRLHSFGFSEARMDQRLGLLTKPTGLTLGFRAHLPLLEIKIMAEGEEAERHAMSFMGSLPDDIMACVVAQDDEHIAAVVGRALLDRKLTLATAESCTGGLLADAWIHYPGSSAYFKHGVICYSNDSKIRECDVPGPLIDQFGAVSAEVAKAMAMGLRQRANTEIALATTGIAGPDGGSPEKPVGTVGISLATPSNTYTQLVRLPDFGRTAIRRVTVMLAVDMLRRYLFGFPVFGSFEIMKTISTDVIS